MRQLDQRVSIRATLKPLNRQEMEAYIAHRLWVARGSTAVTFEPSALDLAHQFTGGVPRIINLLCDRALMLGAQMRVNRVTESIIEEAAGNLGLRLPEQHRARRVRIPKWAIAAVVLVAIVIGALSMVPVDRLAVLVTPVAPPAPQQRVAAPAAPLAPPADNQALPPAPLVQPR
jgi:general secretion pathway protein A